MLRDLSARAPAAGDVMVGIQVPGPARDRGNVGRLALLALLVVAFSGVLWLLVGRQAAPPAPAAPAAVATAPAVAMSHLRLDTELSPIAAVRPAPAMQLAERIKTPPTVARATPPARSTASPAASPTAPAAAPPAAPPAEPVRSERDAREARARDAAGAQALVRGEPKTAEERWREALVLDPDNSHAREALAMHLIDQGRLDEAQRVVEEGLALDSRRPVYRRLAARLDLARGLPDSAVARLEPAPPATNQDPEYHGLLASAYQRLGRHADAARVYRALLDSEPAEAHWWAAYGLSRDALGDASGALAAYAQARQRGSLDPRVLEHINRRTAALQSG